MTDPAAYDAFRTTWRLKESQSHTCLARLLGKTLLGKTECDHGTPGRISRYSPRTRGLYDYPDNYKPITYPPCSPPDGDHARLWIRDGLAYAYTSEPYRRIDATFRAEMDAFAARWGFHYCAGDGGWHNPPSTSLVIWFPREVPYFGAADPRVKVRTPILYTRKQREQECKQEICAWCGTHIPEHAGTHWGHLGIRLHTLPCSRVFQADVLYDHSRSAHGKARHAGAIWRMIAANRGMGVTSD